jgi:ABC-type multidrug transport system ATPase subunit
VALTSDRRSSGDNGGIVTEALHKRFGDHVVLSDATLVVPPGEITGLTGTNGAGKSTLLRILATTLRADGGRATVAGHDVDLSPANVRRKTGLVLGDERTWYWRLSGLNNLEFFAALHGVGRPASTDRAQTLLDELGLSEAGGRRVSDYSAGMRLRLALARALIAKPEVLLLDEPTKSLDAEATEALRARLRKLAGDEAVAILLVTHDPADVRAICTRSVVLDAGVIFPAGDS